MLSNVALGCKNYLQIKSYVVEAIFSPTYADILMDHFKGKYTCPSLEGLFVKLLWFR